MYFSPKVKVGFISLVNFYSYENELDTCPTPGSPETSSGIPVTTDVLSFIWRAAKMFSEFVSQFGASNEIPKVLGNPCEVP